MPAPSVNPALQELQARVWELEAENASLRQLDETLRRNARLFGTLLNRSHDGIVLVTPQMNLLKIVHSVLGNSDEALSGQPVLSFVHPDDADLMRETFLQLLNCQSKTATCKCRFQDKDGTWRWLEVEMTDLLDDPDVQAIVFNSRAVCRMGCQECPPA